MRVAGVITFGGPDALELVEVPDPPAPGPGEVKIRVHAATVNPTDTYMRNGAYRRMLEDREPPYIPGMDAAGIVDELGADVIGFAIGDPVMAVVMPARPDGGAYAEQIVVPIGAVAHAPQHATHAEAHLHPPDLGQRVRPGGRQARRAPSAGGRRRDHAARRPDLPGRARERGAPHPRTGRNTRTARHRVLTATTGVSLRDRPPRSSCPSGSSRRPGPSSCLGGSRRVVG